MAPFSSNLFVLKGFQPCLQIPQIIATPLQRPKTHKFSTLSCHSNPNLDESSTPEKPVGEVSNNRGTSSPKAGPPRFPNKDIKKKISTASFLAALGLFLSTRFHFGVSFKDHCAVALPSKEVLSNGNPTEVEFYEDWREECGELAPDVYNQYK